MSYDMEYNSRKPRDVDIKQPLLNQGNSNGANGNTAPSPTEIIESLDRVSKNLQKLKTYSDKLENGKLQDQERTAMNRIMPDTSKALIKCRELLSNYHKNDSSRLNNKFSTLRTQFEETIQGIKESVEREKYLKQEELEQDNEENQSEEYKQGLKQEFKGIISSFKYI